MKQNLPQQGLIFCQHLPLGVLIVELIRSCSDMVLSPPLDVLFLRPLRRDSSASKYQLLPVIGPGLPVRNYKVLHVW